MNTAMSGKTFTPRARRRALAVMASFGLWGFYSTFFILDWYKAWPLVFFYTLLVLNTYFSVRTFASITPHEHLGQRCMDALLGIWLLLAPLSFNTPIYFVLVTTALFITATIKYIFLAPIVGFSRLLYMKIRIDALGILLCSLALLGVLAGYAYYATAVWSFIFFMANIYVLWWEPHYHLHLHYDESFL